MRSRYRLGFLTMGSIPPEILRKSSSEIFGSFLVISASLPALPLSFLPDPGFVPCALMIHPLSSPRDWKDELPPISCQGAPIRVRIAEILKMEKLPMTRAGTERDQ